MKGARSLKYVLATGIFGLAMLLMTNGTAHAQYYGGGNVWRNQNDHQRWEHSIYGRPHWLKHHQRQERHELKDRLYNRHSYNGGYYNSYPTYGNYGYNVPRNYGYYGNYNRYYVPHYHSGNAFRRGLHHLLGGH